MAFANRSIKAAQVLKPVVEAPKAQAGPKLHPRLTIQARSHATRNGPARNAISESKRKMTTAAPTADAGVFEELNALRGLFDVLPVVKNGPESQPPSEFSFPTGSLFKAPTRQTGVDLAPAYAKSLKENGVVAIEMDFDDPDSSFILEVVDAIGCSPDTHSSTQGALWDVTYKPEGVISEGTGKSAHSISHSLGEFDWHTDAAFEKNPQRYFGFHILHPDKMDGGVFRVLQGDELAKLLSPKSAGTLLTHEFDLKVPDEFFKGSHTVKGKLLHTNEVTGQTFVRYRRDILQDPPSKDPDACEAVEELKNLLDDPEHIGKSMPEFAFKENTVLLMDNARFLHSRTNIKDPRRHLRRVRFRANPGTTLSKST